MTRPAGSASALLFTLALVAGVAIPVQGRINSALAERLADPLPAALVSFATGLVVMAVLTGAVPSGRRALARVPEALRTGRVRWWHLLAGAFGAALVFSQSLTIPLLGLAVFTVAVVTGQIVGGMALDRLGWTPAGVQRIAPRRLVGALLALASVVAVVWPRLGAAGSPGPWLLLALLPLVVGIGTSGQQVMNGHQGSQYGSPLPATLANFVVGTAVLGLLYAVKAAVQGGGTALPAEWWLYLGGPMGCLFVGLAALLVPRVGAFLTTLGMVAGQLVGSLLLDLAAPAPGTHVTALTVLGTGGALTAVLLASSQRRIPGLRRRR